MSFTPSEQATLRMLACLHARRRRNPVLPPRLYECLDCGGIVATPPYRKRKPKPKRRKRPSEHD